MNNLSIDRGTAEDDFEVGVVIPLYDKAPFIRATLESVLAQSHPAKEILIIDDGSTDEGSIIVRSFGDPRIRLIQQSKQGPGQARNRGIKESQSEWIAFIDADDLWLQDHLAELARLSRIDSDVSFLSTSYREVDERAMPCEPESLRVEPQDFFSVPAGRRTICASNVAVRTELLRTLGGFGSDWPGEDVDLWVRLGLDHSVITSPRVTALYRRETDGLTEQYFAGKTAFAPAFIKHLDQALSDESLHGRHALIRSYRDSWHRLLARQAIALGDIATARRHFSQVMPAGREDWILRGLTMLPAPLVRGARTLRSALRMTRSS